MRRRHALTVVIGVVAVASILVAFTRTNSSAAGEDWAPSGASVLIDSTNTSIALGGVTDECDAASAKSTLGEASSTWTFTPEFDECTDPIKVKGAWTATDVNSGEATLTTSGESSSLVIELPSCEITVASSSTIGATGDYTAGTNGLEKPSLLEIASQSVTVTQSPKGCLKVPCTNNEVKTATISGNWNVFDLTHEAEAISLS
jgi:hypothetical protein